MMRQLATYRISDKSVLNAMRAVPRHAFIPESERMKCNPYGDHPCPIGHGQTISQPYIVAYMTERLALKPGSRVLEIGTGSGYQAAILAEMGVEVFSVEALPALAAHARTVLASAGYPGVHILDGNGYDGWPEHKPYDAIILTCAPESIPAILVDQLIDGGSLIAPIGAVSQRLVILHKHGTEIDRRDDLPVRFVPMVRF